MTTEGEGRNEAYAGQLLRELQGQATHGGAKKPIAMSEVTNETSAGPYWQKEDWQRYCTRVVKMLVQQCGYSPEEAEAAVEKNSQGAILWE